MPDPIFSASSLSRAVHDSLDQAMAAIPEGKRGAILIDGTYTDHPEARMLVVAKVKDHWTIAGQGSWDGHHIGGKVSTEITW